MPKWTKSPPQLIELFDAVMPGPPAERRQMFGYPAAFVGGNMFAGLHEHRFVLRLGETDGAELLALGGSAFEPMAGRPMRGYVVAPPSLLADRAALGRWVGRALAHGASLPSKQPKAKSAKSTPAESKSSAKSTAAKAKAKPSAKAAATKATKRR